MRTTLSYERSDKQDAGWREHFFHFLWGYLFPSIREMIRLGACNSQKIFFEMETCGPVMDNITLEAASILNLNIRLVEIRGIELDSCIIVPRWDKLLRKCYDWHIRNQQSLPNSGTNIVIPTEVIPDGGQFISDIHTVRNLFLSKTNTDGESSGFLILKRSDEPAYYKPWGGAIRSTYGNSRRALNGIDEAVQKLNDQGFRVTSFEPGRHALSKQIEMFHKSTGVAGIRGAEFANMIWMRPGSTVIMLEPPGMLDYGVQHLLANLLDLHFTHLKTGGETFFPKLKPEVITPYLPFDHA